MKYDHYGENQRKAIADRLRTERKAKNLTQEELASKLLLSKPTINKWEKADGKNSVPSMDQFVALCELYCCDIGYLLCEYDSRWHEIADIRQQIPLDDKAIDTLLALGTMIDEPESTLYDFNFIDFLIRKLEPCFTDILKDIKSLKELVHDRQELESDEHFEDYNSIYHHIQFELTVAETPADLFDVRHEFSTRINNIVQAEPLKKTDSFCQLIKDHRYNRVYDILDGTTEKGLRFSMQDQFMDIVKRYIDLQDTKSERQGSDHGEHETK